MNLEVEIEDGVVPDAKEIVRVGFYKKGEQVVTVKGTAVECLQDCNDGFVYLIVRDKWTPGSVSLKPGWVAMDYGGGNRVWWWHEQEPQRSQHDGNVTWLSAGKMMQLCGINWTPPPCTGPEDSLREIK